MTATPDRRRAARMRCVRLALIVAALVGIALAQGAPCPDSMPIVPSATWATHAAAGLLAETADRMAEPALPLGLLGVCLTVLVAMVAAIAVRRRPEHGRAAVRRLEDRRSVPRSARLARGPTLAELCVLRT